MASDGEEGSGRCMCCSLCCAICRIAFVTIVRRLCSCCFGPPPAPKEDFSVICLGLEGAGKSSLLSQLTGEAMDDMEPTMGFSIKDIVTSRAILHVKEVGGSEKIRTYWSRYYPGQQAIIYVVDSTASNDDLQETAQMLGKCLSDANLAGLPLLVLCSKQDIAGATLPNKLKETLQLDSIAEGRPCTVSGCSAKDTSSVRTGMESLVDLLMLPGARMQDFDN